jgi:hypothetical protein
MKALTWKEPYASLMLCGKIETRTWKTNVRGTILICASQKPYKHNDIARISGPYQMDRMAEAFKKHNIKNICDNYGYAIAIGDLVDCRPMKPTDEDDCFVIYRPGLWCHIYKNVQPITPFIFKGKQGWTELNDSMFNIISKW